MSAVERFLRSPHQRQVAKALAFEAESGRFSEVTPEFGLFVARTSRKASDEIAAVNRSFGSEGKAAFESEMNVYVRQNINLPEDDRDVFPPRYSFRYRDNPRLQFHIVEFGYEPGDKTNQVRLRKAAELVHAGLQKNRLAKGSYDVQAEIGWDNYADFIADTGSLYGMESLRFTMDEGDAGSLSLATDYRGVVSRSPVGQQLDVIAHGGMRGHLSQLIDVIQPTHLLLELPHSTQLQSRIMDMVRRGIAINHPDFSFGDRSVQWSDLRYLLPTKYLAEAHSLTESNMYDPESADRIVGFVKAYEGSEHTQFVKRAKDIQTLAQVVGEPSDTFDAYGRRPRHDVSDYERYLPAHSRVRSISLQAGKKPLGHNTLFVGSRLEVNCDLNDNSLHHLQSQAACAAGIQFRTERMI